MKKSLFTLLLVALSAMAFAQQWTGIGSNTPVGPEVKLISSSEQQVVVDFSLSGFSLTQVSTPNGTQQVVSVPEMATMLEAGAPNLPYYPVPVIIGDLAEMQVRVAKCNFTDYENIEIAPSKGNISRQIDPATVPYTYGEMYSKNAFWPANQAELDMPYILRDFRGQNIVVRPFAYNPVTKTLRVYTNLTIEMRKVSDNGINPKATRKSAQKVSSEMKAAYGRRFINYKENTRAYPFVEDRGEMLVICADQFMEAMQPFVDWKNQSGRPTTMVSVSEVGGNNDNVIKTYITRQYNDPESNLVYVLFVGDYEHITPHALSGERSDNWFGQIEGNDHYPEVFIGRFSVQNDEHVATMVNKVIFYERDLNDNVPVKAPTPLTWVDKGLGIGCIGAGSGHYGEDDYVHIDYIRDTLEHYTYEHVTELHGGGGGATPESISATINDGVSIINYCNHGSESGWGVAGYSSSHVHALVNDNMWPIVWSVACLCGKFNYGSECFAEAWMRATDNNTGVPTGAIGGMFSWMSQPWIPPMYGQDEMVDILCEWRSADQFNHTLAGASLNGNMSVIDMSGGQGYDTHDTWILFGDPTLLVRTDNPVSMGLNYSPSVLFLGMTELEITTIDTPFGIATLMMDDEVLASGYIQDNSCTLTFPELSNVGVATLTVIGYNKVTEIRDIEVLPAEGPYIVVDGFNPNFCAVGEPTDMSISFKNVGVDATDGNVNITLSCADPRLSFNQSSATLYPMSASETATLNNAFNFTISEGVEDGTRFQIDVEMNDNSHSWLGRAIITAGQAILEYDSPARIEGYVPGENVTFVAKFKNIGHYHAKNAVATISCDNPNITLLNTEVEAGTIDPDGTATCVFHVSVDPNCPATEQIPFTVTMTADGGLIAEGTVVMLNLCNVVFQLTDSWGDGWNGASLTVRFDDGTPDAELTVSAEEGRTHTETIAIGVGTHVILIWNRGQYDSECSFTVSYEGGDQIYHGSNLQAGQLFEFDCMCDVVPTVSGYTMVDNLDYTVDNGDIILTWDQAMFALSYTVYRNGIEIGNTTDVTYTDPVGYEATYTYCVVANYTNTTSLPACVVFKAEWAIEENEAEFSVYPNPVSGTLYVDCGNAEYSYQLYNGMGQVVANGNARGTAQINVNDLTQGIYFLRLTSGTQVIIEKVVVK